MIITATTNDKIRRNEYLKGDEQYEVILSDLSGDYGRPNVVGKEGNLYSLYYDYNFDDKFGDTLANVYALKVDKDTGLETRKVYYRDNTSGLTVDHKVVATGEFLDEPNAYTLYHGEGVTFGDAVTMAKPYTGTTYKNGEATRVTNYSKG